MENSTPQFHSADTRDYKRKLGIAEILSMKKAIQLRAMYAAKYWAELGRI